MKNSDTQAILHAAYQSAQNPDAISTQDRILFYGFIIGVVVLFVGVTILAIKTYKSNNPKVAFAK